MYLSHPSLLQPRRLASHDLLSGKPDSSVTRRRCWHSSRTRRMTKLKILPNTYDARRPQTSTTGCSNTAQILSNVNLATLQLLVPSQRAHRTFHLIRHDRSSSVELGIYLFPRESRYLFVTTAILLTDLASRNTSNICKTCSTTKTTTIWRQLQTQSTGIEAPGIRH